MGIKSIPYDFDLILYYYNALKAGKVPSYDLHELMGMKKYIDENGVEDSVLLYMIDYVIDKLKKI